MAENPFKTYQIKFYDRDNFNQAIELHTFADYIGHGEMILMYCDMYKRDRFSGFLKISEIPHYLDSDVESAKVREKANPKLSVDLSVIPEEWFLYKLADSQTPVIYLGDTHNHKEWVAEIQHFEGGRLSRGNAPTPQIAINKAVENRFKKDGK